MGRATSFRDFLEKNHLAYDIVHHKKNPVSIMHWLHTYQVTIVAKAMLIYDGERYTLAVVPASHRLHFGRSDSV